jgi:hypothetical protein
MVQNLCLWRWGVAASGGTLTSADGAKQDAKTLRLLFQHIQARDNLLAR